MNDIKNTFESMNEAELDALLSELGDEKLDKLTSRRIAKSALNKTGAAAAEKRALRPRLKRRAAIAVAASLALMVSLCVGSFAYAAEAREYSAALAYFEANGISTEGLTRSEIKTVYREFVTKTSENGRNAEKTDTVEGVSFPGETDAIADEEIVGIDRAYTNRVRGGHKEQLRKSMTDEGFVRISNYVDGRRAWSYTVDSIDAGTTMYVEGGTVIIGSRLVEGSADGGTPDKRVPAAIKLSYDGGFMWLCDLEEGSREITAVGTKDGSVVFFGTINEDPDGDLYANKGVLAVTKVNDNGEKVFSEMNRTGMPVVVTSAHCFGEGFIAAAVDAIGADSHLVNIDSEGRIVGRIDYELDGYDCWFVGIKEFGGKLYISEYAAAEDFVEMAGSDMDPNTTSEEAFEYAKSSVKGLLLVCDTAGGDLRVFYEAEGSLAGDLSINEDGELEWIVYTVCSAEVRGSSTSEGEEDFGIYSTFKVYRYRFAEDGSFLERYDTGVVTDLNANN